MRNKSKVFYRGKVCILADFSGEEISSDGSVLLLEKLERKHKLIDYYSKFIPDKRDPTRTVHSIKKMLKQRTYMLVHGYEDCNDVDYLKNDPLYQDILGGQMASQPTLSRLENSLDKASIFEFSCPAFYILAKKYGLKYAIGQSSNEVLKTKISRAYKAVEHLYLNNGQKHQHFIEYQYKASTWEESQKCISKVESTGRGMNVRHIITNIEGKSRPVYFDFYVQRGEASENRIKEVKNMCFSDRLSTHGFWSNFLRLLLSSLAYEFMLLLKGLIKQTKFKEAKKWQMDTIRRRLLKVGATIKKTKRRIYYRLSKSFVHQELFMALIEQK